MRHKRKGDIFEEWAWARSRRFCPCPQTKQLDGELSSVVLVITTEARHLCKAAMPIVCNVVSQKCRINPFLANFLTLPFFCHFASQHHPQAPCKEQALTEGAATP